MSLDLVAICLDAHDPALLARFWAGVLEREVVERPHDGFTLLPLTEKETRVDVVTTAEAKTAPNRLHLDLASATPEEQATTVARALDLGGRRIDVGQGPDADHVVMADPEGNELCVIEAGNSFLAGCGLIGALSCDGTPEVGRFWSRALGWPLVWDQDEETAIQSPRGGSKITWGGPPYVPRAGRDRLHLHIAPGDGGSRDAEVTRLLELGAALVDGGRGEVGVVSLTDPDGNVFCVVDPSGS